ncbi:MAG TPA: VIT1/CCC1 transporter family protein [Mycobacteriales bacterium]|jgi:VIT1/CCC1 family predicted Fe2+/Mn2+ transporter|nr:VIT1/CCC1 transporter family protein [Mycobacteriales bacterium]
MGTTAPHRVDHHVRHRNITGGWLRPALFGVTDGLVSNFALVMGVAGATPPARIVLLAGLAGLFAGAFSMATGEYNSVRSQSELASAEIALERRELERAPEAEEAELAGIYRSRGLDASLAREVARQFARDPEVLWRVHAREELGIDPDNLPSPWVAASASFVAFALGAFVPVSAYLLALANAFVLAAVLSAVTLFAVGAVVGAMTARPWWYTGSRQLLLGAGAAAVTFAVGSAVGVGV